MFLTEKIVNILSKIHVRLFPRDEIIFTLDNITYGIILQDLLYTCHRGQVTAKKVLENRFGAFLEFSLFLAEF